MRRKKLKYKLHELKEEIGGNKRNNVAKVNNNQNKVSEDELSKQVDNNNEELNKQEEIVNG